MNRLTHNRRTILICGLLAVLALAAFWRVTHNDFIKLDDRQYVTENPHVQGGFTWENVKCAFQAGYASNWHPVTWLSHTLDVRIFGLRPGWHHLINLLLHTANAILLFLVLNRVTGAVWRSAVVAALFAVHPLHVESVAWVAERKDVLSTFFFILTLSAYARYAAGRRPGSEGSGRLGEASLPSRLWYVAALGACHSPARTSHDPARQRGNILQFRQPKNACRPSPAHLPLSRDPVELHTLRRQMNADKLKSLQIEPAQKRRPQRMLWTIFIVVLVATLAVLYVARPRPEDKVRVMNTGLKPFTNSARVAATSPQLSGTNSSAVSADAPILTVSGYIINRERIEISPRFLGVVKWIGVKKGDAVTNGQVVVLLDDMEQVGHVHEAEAQLANAKAAIAKAELDYQRTAELAQKNIESRKAFDDARLQLEAARASLRQTEATVELAKLYLDWTIIRSPVNGVVLEKLVEPNELVVPQSFGGTRGPSTALIAVADPKDLQVEIDLNEADLSKVHLDQRCRVSPEAYPDKVYQGYVAEIAPEANRQKGTLQVKVQIREPDKFLTPELSAKVDFLNK